MLAAVSCGVCVCVCVCARASAQHYKSDPMLREKLGNQLTERQRDNGSMFLDEFHTQNLKHLRQRTRRAH
jgi:hypothetical protein